MPAIDTQHGKKARTHRGSPGPPNFPSYVPPRPGAVKPKARPKPKTAPKSSSGVAPNFPTYVPPRPGAVKPPSKTKLAHIQETQYKSQAGAVRRAAATQRQPGLGPGKAVRPKGKHEQVLTKARIREAATTRLATAQEQGYKSLGESVAKRAEQARTEREAKRKVAISLVGPGGKKQTKLIDASRLSKDPKLQKAGGLKKAGALEGIISSPKTAIKALSNAPKDLAELAVTTPTSLAHLGVEGAKLSTAVAAGNYPKALKQGLKIGKEQAEPYKELAKHPEKFSVEHPVTTALMLQPFVKAPLAGAARGLRLAGKATTRRAPATVPGSAIKEPRTAPKQLGSLNVARRATGRTGPHATEADIKRQVDEHIDLAHHIEERRVAHTEDIARRFTRGQPKHVRDQTIHDAVRWARDDARTKTDELFARTFGATEEPQVRAGQVKAAQEARDAAEAQKGHRRRGVKQARKGVERERAAARTAVADSPELRDLESQRESARREVAHEQGRHATARVKEAEAKGRASVSVAKPKSSPKLEELQGKRDRAVETDLADKGWGVDVARKRVSDADKRVNQIEKQVQKAEERASHLEGVTVGQFRAGKLTGHAGRAAATQAERVGQLYDALHEAHTEAQAARTHLKEVVQQHRGRVRDATKDLDQQIAAEQRRISGVAPGPHEGLLGAIEERDAAAGRVHAARVGVRDLDERIGEERRQVRLRARGRVVAARQQHSHAVQGHQIAVAVHRMADQAARAAKQAHEQGPLANPEQMGRVYENKADATRTMKALNEQGHTIRKGGKPLQLRVREPGTEGRVVTPTLGHGEAPVEYTVKKIEDGRWMVAPKVATQRAYGGGGRGSYLSHASVGTGKATLAKGARASRALFTKSTLPVSFKWLGGQGAEAGIRAAVEGAGPFDYRFFQRAVDRANELEPNWMGTGFGAGDIAEMRVSGGQFGATGAIAEQLGRKPLAEQMQGAGLGLESAANLASLVGETAPARLAKGGYNALTRRTTLGLNNLIEDTTRKAMAGQALKKGPHLENRLASFERMRESFGKINRAVEQAAQGLLDVPGQIELVREVDGMYGRYSKWSPETKSLLMHWTPFLPWYLNVAKFMFHTLPVKHPMKAALLANMNKADQEWRKQQKLSFYGKSHVPDFLMGSYPTGGDRYLRVGHYTPWGIGPDLPGALADLVLPQLSGSLQNWRGLDWKNQPLTKTVKGKKRPMSIPEHALRGAVTLAEAQLPGLSKALNWSGLESKYIDKRPDERSFLEKLKSESPTTSTKAPKKKAKKAPTGLGGGGLGGGGLGGGGLGGGGLGG